MTSDKEMAQVEADNEHLTPHALRETLDNSVQELIGLDDENLFKPDTLADILANTGTTQAAEFGEDVHITAEDRHYFVDVAMSLGKEQCQRIFQIAKFMTRVA